MTDLVRAREQAEALSADLREAVAARDTFLSIASHELRTPLTALLLQVQLLHRAAERTAGAGAISDKAVTVERQVHRLAALIDNLLDISRITLGRLVLERNRVDLVPIAREVAARLEPEATAVGCRLELDLCDSLSGSFDRSRIDQVITNLLGNALKYGAGRPVSLRVDRAENQAVVTVRDEGIGIAPSDQTRIFERFERAVSDRHYGGFGMGLWITRQIVEAHGGRVAVDSAPGHGSAFIVKLPL